MEALSDQEESSTDGSDAAAQSKTHISLVKHAPTRASRPAGIFQGFNKLGWCATSRFFPTAGAGFGSNTNTWRRCQMLSLPAVHPVDPVARSDRLQQLQS